MSNLVRNGGTAGLIAAIFLAIVVILVLSAGPPTDDPAKILANAQTTRAKAAGILGLLGVGFSVVFTVGLYAHLRDRAPTRAHATLYIVLVGLAGYALGAVTQWVGAPLVAGVAARDQTAAIHALLAVYAIGTTFNALGNAFVGAGFLVAAWAILGTRALSAVSGWVAVIAGVLMILTAFYSGSVPLFIGSFAITIIWLAWVGLELRRPAPAMEAARA